VAVLKVKYTSETSKILEAQKDSHRAIASCTKALQNVPNPSAPSFPLWLCGAECGQKFKADPSTVISADVFDGKETEVNTTIAMHLIRRGHFELADTFIRVRTSLGTVWGLTGVGE
jgi:hypothetical protein